MNDTPKLIANEIAYFCERLARSTAIDADNLMLQAKDHLVNDGGSDRAKMILDGMRAGIQQAREADVSGRVVAIWFDDRGARATFSWDVNDEPSPDMLQAIAQALNSALRPNGSDTK